MFSPAECLARNHSFMHIAEKATRVFLLSESVKRDFEAFTPEHAHKARVLSPVTYIPSAVYETDPVSIIEQYGLPHKFIYLPNQLWKHKNHVAVFHALKILKSRGTEVFLVCSGNLTDYRHPAYLSDLLQDISRLKIRNQIAILGLIPREHVFQLMRQSVCVLNPSLFEGYGMTIDEARSLGKRVLLSDLPVHHEQNPPLAVFFDPRNYDDLANKIEMFWSAELPGPGPDLETQARQELPKRMRNFAESFISIAKEVAC
jgi:glycosyltransferase involved in cell wall biosynthesis